MKVYLIETHDVVEPFFERANELFVGNKSLKSLQKDYFLKLGLDPVKVKHISEINDGNEHIFLEDNLYVEIELLKLFIKESRKIGANTVCSVKQGIFTTRTIVPTQEIKILDNHVEYPLYYSPRGGTKGEIKPIIFDLDKDLENIPLPNHMQDGCKYFIPVTKYPIVRINHWCNLWSANLALLLAMVAHLKQNKIKLIMSAIMSFSLNKWKILSRLNRVGKGCDIHPTAYIEGSIIGNNVIIGANAILKESIIGDNCFIGNGVIIELSSIGDNCSILNGHLLYSVFYSHVFSVAHMISASIIGRDSFIGSGAILTDFRLDGKTMMVTKENQKIDTKNIFLGCCLGHNVYLGGGCVVAPGRAIPNGLRISMERGRVITKIVNNEIEGFEIIK